MGWLPPSACNTRFCHLVPLAGEQEPCCLVEPTQLTFHFFESACFYYGAYARDGADVVRPWPCPQKFLFV